MICRCYILTRFNGSKKLVVFALRRDRYMTRAPKTTVTPPEHHQFVEKRLFRRYPPVSPAFYYANNEDRLFLLLTCSMHRFLLVVSLIKLLHSARYSGAQRHGRGSLDRLNATGDPRRRWVPASSTTHDRPAFRLVYPSAVIPAATSVAKQTIAHRDDTH
jgi:hypothetical protein